MEALPFLFAKNDKGAGWAPVVVPSIVNDQESRKLLLAAQAIAELPEGIAKRVTGEHSVLGIFDVVFRAKPSGLRDEAGRDFDFWEGFVLRRRDPDFQIYQEHLDAVHDAVMPKFHHFWNEGSGTDAQIASDQVIDLTKVEGRTPFKEMVEERAAPFVASSQTARRTAQHAPSAISPPSAKWTERLHSAWAKPGVRGAVICGAVAAVAVGVCVVVARRRREAKSDAAAPSR